ncbi:protocadherin Fat 4 [Oreochromis aureus]|uniref:protocadherin Fat 4 n=1 Tax=Oreochromis aureus TaxID=47969 RepID=UPI001953C8AD|nr:protocadherin Fat 4 [Oreochromis aureus]
MDMLSKICLVLILSIFVCVITGSPIGTSTINCNAVTPPKYLGEVNEGYSGDVERIEGIVAGTSVKLVDHIFVPHLEFLELSFTPGDTFAVVRTKKPLDADVPMSSATTLYYSVMCDGAIKYNNTRTLKIIDLNDNAPIFEKKLYSKDVSETLNLNAEVIRVTATDADATSENNRVTYSIAPATEDFEVTDSGAFMLKRRLNYNAVQNYHFTVTAKDKEGLNDTASVVINVDDFDNLNPYFSHSLYQAFISENQLGLFYTIQPEAIKAQDGDIGINMTLTYTISGVSPDKYQRNFNTDPSSGVLSVIAAFDREEMNSSMISITIKAAQTDDSMKTTETVVSVTVEDVNDNAPEFDEPSYSVTLLENSPVDAVLFKASVTDLDQGGFVGTMRIIPESAPFSISSDGTVRVKNSTALDRETTETITFQVEAREQHEPNNVATTQVTVTLLDENDNIPKFTSGVYEGKVFANQTEGLLLVQVRAEDPDVDVNGQIAYSIDFGNSRGYFTIDENTGEITLAKTIPLQENQILEFPLYVTAKDGGVIPRSSSAQVNIFAPGDSKPQFLQKLYHFTIEEEQEPGVAVLKVNYLAVHPAIPVFLVATEGDKFKISDSGEFTTKVKLDHDEGPQNYSVEITITDGTSSDSAVVEIQVTDINDNSPVFSSSSVTKSVLEDAEVGFNVTAVPATDKDSGFNKEIRYSLRGGEGSFSIDPVSGMVSLAGALDRETKAEYSLLVVAEDQGRPARSATATLTVQVSDINDNAPKFSVAEYQVEILETESVGASLLTLSALDPDESVNGIVTYSIFQQSPSSDPAVFDLELSTGILRLVQPLDYSEVNMYTLKVQATDGGTPSLVGNGSVVVKIKDENNNPPEFSKEIYHMPVYENLPGGASILVLEVTDKDEGGFSNGYFLYNNDTFEINKQGVVSLRRDVALDRETKDSYLLQVVAVDQVTNGLSSTAELNFTILDYNDNSPQFPSIPDPLMIIEGNYSKESPGEIFTITPTDADLGLNGEVTLSLISPHPLFRFREDGTLLAIGPLDRENRETYDLTVKALDKGNPPRENFTSIRVSLADLNDNKPVFSSSDYVSTILLKDAEEGKLLLTLSATDRDTGNNSLITYSFSGEGSPYLDLNTQTGNVTLTSKFADLTEDTTLVLTAVATDHGQSPLSTTARVVVNLKISSLTENVAFLSFSYNFSLPENQEAGVLVGKVTASSGSNLYNVTYSLNTHKDLFSINLSGAIFTKAQLDKEQQEWYFLEVEVVDTRNPPTSAMTTVRVQVEDVNESPHFPPEVYSASVFSIAPYKTPVIQVKASDPDVGDVGQLVYSLTAESPYFDMDPSSGLLYVISATELAGQTAKMEVKATDPHDLHATAIVEVMVQASASSSDIVTISLNQPANIVEKKVEDLSTSLGKVLGWTVNIVQVFSANDGSTGTRNLRVSVRTLVSFFAVDGGQVVSSEEVIKKLQSQSDAVNAELSQLFGEELHFDVEIVDPQGSTSNQAVIIALGILFGLSILGLIIAVAFLIRFHTKGKQGKSSDKNHIPMDQQSESSINSCRKPSHTSEQGLGKGETSADPRPSSPSSESMTSSHHF